MERPSSPSFSVLHYLKGTYVAFAFCSALILGALKGIVVGPIACLILITGNVGVILGLFPAHVTWTVGAIIKTKRFVLDLKLVLLFSIPFLFGFWLVVGITGSVLVGFGYGFFTPWVSTFEAFRQDGEFTKFSHCVVDGTWDTIKGSCVVVRDFADICYHSYPLYLKETSERTTSDEPQTIRLMEVPKCIIIGLMGLIVEIPLFTIIAVTKSPFMLFKGWQRLLHDLVSREGPFLETACVPIAGLAILLWPLVVLGSILLSIFSSFFIGLYGAVVVYQERSFRRGLAYVIAMVAEFDEYTNDLLYLREGSPLPKPGYRKKIEPQNKDFSNGIDHVSATQHLRNNTSNTSEAPGMLVPNLAHTRSVREAIQEVKMVQVWEEIMRSYEANGKQLVDANVITTADLAEYGRATKLKSNSISNSSGGQASIIGHGLPSYSCLNALLRSIKMGSEGWVLSNGVELTHANRPQDRLMDWFFHPLLVLKEQIKAIKMVEGEVRFLEKFTLFSGDEQGMEAWNNGSVVPQDALRNAQIQAISRRYSCMEKH
ncbi:hypothetical protein AMTR_s00126p00089850 [Amborella trichopoda]|uniref:Uncharacterized protein n=1 Tax=Amborella trichopoda TaxID=13333 RepID=W1NMM4_AMBTC|nr:hypothetical protein AMTR_s00126p00089850 [Amborella trichopoda]